MKLSDSRLFADNFSSPSAVTITVTPNREDDDFSVEVESNIEKRSAIAALLTTVAKMMPYLNPRSLMSAYIESGRSVKEKEMVANTVIENPLPGNTEPVSITVNVHPLESGQAVHQLFSTLPAAETKKLLNAMHERLMEKVK
tara:strand:- start:414 stop:839 length:426 start_codon:yes stop_codon:yes gene_type:complete